MSPENKMCNKKVMLIIIRKYRQNLLIILKEFFKKTNTIHSIIVNKRYVKIFNLITIKIVKNKIESSIVRVSILLIQLEEFKEVIVRKKLFISHFQVLWQRI